MRLRFLSCAVPVGCGIAMALAIAPARAGNPVVAPSESATGQLPGSAGSGDARTIGSAVPRTRSAPFGAVPSRAAPRSYLPTYASQRSAHSAASNSAGYAPGFFGGNASRASLSQLPGRMPIRPASPQPVYRQAKPFETIYRDPTVSPYLNLYRADDETEGAPNYFALVRPQLDQIEANRQQQRQIQQLRGQLQTISTTIATPQYGGGATTPATGTRSRYMDTAQFYGGWRR